jgi:hypothetical protein
MQHLEETKIDILNFVGKSFDELRTKMNLTPGATIGVSFLPDFVANHIPESEPVRPGMYVDQTESMHVEVLDHDTLNDIVKMEVVINGEPIGQKRVQAVSGFMFKYLFRPAVIDPLS